VFNATLAVFQLYRGMLSVGYIFLLSIYLLYIHSPVKHF